MRDDLWLQQRLDLIWTNLFPDVEKKNVVHIRFKGRWKNKFGHIKLLKTKASEIAINRYFMHDHVPDAIIDLTIAHELVHYMHGFNSPHPRLYKHPHAGGIVNRELKKRGLHKDLRFEKQWIKKEWEHIVKTEFPRKQPPKGLFSLFKF